MARVRQGATTVSERSHGDGARRGQVPHCPRPDTHVLAGGAGVVVVVGANLARGGLAGGARDEVVAGGLRGRRRARSAGRRRGGLGRGLRDTRGMKFLGQCGGSAAAASVCATARRAPVPVRSPPSVPPWRPRAQRRQTRSAQHSRHLRPSFVNVFTGRFKSRAESSPAPCGRRRAHLRGAAGGCKDLARWAVRENVANVLRTAQQGQRQQL